MLLQFSAALGPEECRLAVTKALARLHEEAQSMQVELSVLEEEPGPEPGTLRSALVSLSGAGAETLARRWCGTLQWVCPSPFRTHYPRKNWFIGVARFDEPSVAPEGEIRFEMMRASGPGGQHVNKTSSAVRATHSASGISVKVQTERSQHANRQLARCLIAYKLAQAEEARHSGLRAERRLEHHHLERGNPLRIFRGERFLPDNE